MGLGRMLAGVQWSLGKGVNHTYRGGERRGISDSWVLSPQPVSYGVAPLAVPVITCVCVGGTNLGQSIRVPHCQHAAPQGSGCSKTVVVNESRSPVLCHLLV